MSRYESAERSSVGLASGWFGPRLPDPVPPDPVPPDPLPLSEPSPFPRPDDPAPLPPPPGATLGAGRPTSAGAPVANAVFRIGV